MARITGPVVLSVRRQGCVNAAIARGKASGYIVPREMPLNVVAPIIVEMSIRVAFAMTLCAIRSFLGVGERPKLAICEEATPSLDVSVQAAVMRPLV